MDYGCSRHVGTESEQARTHVNLNLVHAAHNGMAECAVAPAEDR